MAPFNTDKCRTFTRLNLVFFIFSLFSAIGLANPYGYWTDPDSLGPSSPQGHLKCVIKSDTNCITKTVKLTAYFEFLFTGGSAPVGPVPWSTGITAPSITVIPPGTWSYDDSGLGCDHHLNSVTLPPYFLGPLDILGPPAICPGGGATLTVVDQGYEFFAFEWSPANSGSLDISPYEVSTPGLYSLTVTDQYGCTAKDTYFLPLSPPVLPQVPQPAPICPGDTATINVSAPAYNSYTWSDGQSGNPIQVTEPGLYEVTVTNVYGCTGVGITGVQDAQIGPFDITASKPAICIGQNDTLKAIGNFISYKWSNNAISPQIIVTQPGTYTVTVTNLYGCTSTDDITIGLLPTPVVSINTPPLCPGGNAVLSVNGGAFSTYSWTGGATTSTLPITVPGNYSVTVTKPNTCPAVATATVNLAPLPTVVVAPPALISCTQTQITLDGTGSSNGPPYVLNWTAQNGGNFVSGTNTLNPVVNAVGTYILQITDTLTQCVNSVSTAVDKDNNIPSVSAGNPGLFTCTVNSLTLGPATPPTDPNLQYSWSTTGGNFTSSTTIWNPTINQPGQYSVTATNTANGCTAVAGVTVGIDTLAPSVSIASPPLITCTQSTVTLTGTGSANVSYQWSTINGSITSPVTTTPSVNVNSVGQYTLVVTNNVNGCTSSASTNVAADNNIPVVLAAPADTLTCAIKTVTINATGSSSGPTYTYQWTTSGGGTITNPTTLTPTVNGPGTYNLLLTNTANNCTATLAVVVPINIAAPTADAGNTATLNCTATSLVLDGSASSSGSNFTYLWATSGTGNISGPTDILNPVATAPGVYTLTVTDLVNGCTSTASVQILSDANAPNALIAPPQTLTCKDLQVTVNGSGSTQGPSITYQWAGVGIMGSQFTDQITVTLPGTYTLTITNTQNGCTDVESVIVPQDIVAPVADAGTDLLINCKTPAGVLGNAGNPSGAGFTLSWTTVGGNFTSPTNQPTVNVDSSGTYQLLITNTQNGCTDIDDVVVTEDFQKPAIDAGNTAELTCIVKTFTLQASGSTGSNFSYQWTTNGGNFTTATNILAPTVNASGTYTVLVTNNQNGCTNTDQVQITQDANVPTAIAGPPQLLTCTTTSITLNGSGSTTGTGITYSWSTATGSITSGMNSLMPTVNKPGTYVLTVTNTTNNCSAVSSVIVPQNIQQPVVNAGADPTLTCTVNSLTLSGQLISSPSPNPTYLWTTTNGQIVLGATTLTPTVNKTGDYTLIVTDALNGCTSTDVVTVLLDVNQPVAVLANPLTLTCAIPQVNVNGAGSTTGPNITNAWSTQGGNFVVPPSGLLTTVDQPGIYTLLVTNTTNGCTQSATVTVLQDVQKPLAEAGQTLILDCDTPTGTLNGTGSSTGANFTYSWTTSNGQITGGGTTLMPTIAAPGVYQINVLNNTNGCSQTDNVTITQDIQKPTAAVAPPQVLTCTLLNTNLNATVTTAGSAPTYSWATSNGNIVSGGNTLTPNVNEPGTYTLTVLNTINGCTITAQTIVTENVVPPTASIAQPPLLTCTVKEVTVTGTVSSQTSLNWSTNNGQIISGQGTPSIKVGAPGTYTLQVVSSVNGCTTSAQTLVAKETNIPTGLDYELTQPNCLAPLGILEIVQVQGGVGPFKYSVDNGQTFDDFEIFEDLDPGDYKLVISDANGCTITQNFKVVEPKQPGVSVTPEIKVKLGQELTLDAVLPGGYSPSNLDTVIWTPSDGLIFSGNSILALLKPKAKPFANGTYTVTVVTPEGCTASAQALVRVDKDVNIYVPNVIKSEDPDGDNGVFTIFDADKDSGVDKILLLQIFTRWGEMVFENRNFDAGDLNQGWKGDFKGSYVNPGVFVWQAEVRLIDGRIVLLKGDVTVIR